VSGCTGGPGTVVVVASTVVVGASVLDVVEAASVVVGAAEVEVEVEVEVATVVVEVVDVVEVDLLATVAGPVAELLHALTIAAPPARASS
jgi:hypothetical protein